jgi:hypothetical protein
MTNKTSAIDRTPIIADRVRGIDGQGFCFVPHRFLRDGFFASLSPEELLLYFVLVLAGDRHGISFYHYDRLCSLLQMSLETFLTARNGLIDKDLIAFDGRRYQVLSLPARPVAPKSKALSAEDFEDEDPATIHAIIKRSLDLEE